MHACRPPRKHAHARARTRERTCRCWNIDECATGTHDCHPLVSCKDTNGSFVCGPCPPGYIGGGRGPDGCRDINECRTVRVVASYPRR
jgi:hypothetical protein